MGSAYTIDHKERKVISLAGLARGCFIVAFAIITIYPLFWMLTVAVKTQQDFMSSPIGLPLNPTLKSLWGVITNPQMTTFAINSIVVSGIVVGFVLILSSLAGYALARLEFPGRDVILLCFLTAQWIPLVILIIPLFVTLKLFGLYGSLVGLILVYISSSLGIGIFIMRGFFRNLPQETLDSAFLDGCNDIQAFFYIAWPQTTQGLAVVAILSFLSAWNEYFMAVVLLSDSGSYTLPLGISFLFQGKYAIDWPSLTGALLIATLPPMLLYVFFSDVISRSIARSTGFGGR
jgi:raffinose/stachyose/melibiose transport system permease protein